MALSSGARLGPNVVVCPIGAGGMGEVYLAQDTKLNRRVAIKVRPETHVADPDRVARFDREAKAALNHPNVAAIYDLAESTPGSDAIGRYLSLSKATRSPIASTLARSHPTKRCALPDKSTKRHFLVWLGMPPPFLNGCEKT